MLANRGQHWTLMWRIWTETKSEKVLTGSVILINLRISLIFLDIFHISNKTGIVFFTLVMSLSLIC